jgi:hypothetical protein
MKSRNELAHDYLCALLANPRAYDDLEVQKATAVAFGVADAFLAACGEKPAQEREPDAVWTLERYPACNNRILYVFDERYAVAVSPEAADRLLAGRDRVKLAVRVVEDSES